MNPNIVHDIKLFRDQIISSESFLEYIQIRAREISDQILSAVEIFVMREIDEFKGMQHDVHPVDTEHIVGHGGVVPAQSHQIDMHQPILRHSEFPCEHGRKATMHFYFFLHDVSFFNS